MRKITTNCHGHCQQGQAEIKVKKMWLKRPHIHYVNASKLALKTDVPERWWKAKLHGQLLIPPLSPTVFSCIINSEYPGCLVSSAYSQKAEADPLLHRLLFWEMAGVLQEQDILLWICHWPCRWGRILHSAGQCSPKAFAFLLTIFVIWEDKALPESLQKCIWF